MPSTRLECATPKGIQVTKHERSDCNRECAHRTVVAGELPASHPGGHGGSSGLGLYAKVRISIYTRHVQSKCSKNSPAPWDATPTHACSAGHRIPSKWSLKAENVTRCQSVQSFDQCFNLHARKFVKLVTDVKPASPKLRTKGGTSRPPTVPANPQHVRYTCIIQCIYFISSTVAQSTQSCIKHDAHWCSGVQSAESKDHHCND
jgi:hypothetical protein